MAGPFDRTGINQSDVTPEPTVIGTQTGRGIIFGPVDTITVNPDQVISGTKQDQGVIFGPSDVITVQPEDPVVGTSTDPGVIFGNPLNINFTEEQRPDSGGGGRTGTGITYVDSLPTTGMVEDIVITNNDFRTYSRGTNTWIQIAGQESIQIRNAQTQTNDLATNIIFDNDYEQIPTYFQGGGEYVQ